MRVSNGLTAMSVAQVSKTKATRIASVCVLAVCVSTLSGCIHFSKVHNSIVSGPDTPKALQVNAQINSDVLSEIRNYYFGRCLLDSTTMPAAPLSSPAPNCGARREQRDTIVYDLKRIIDYNYDAYARHFQQTADTANFLGEVSAASLTAVSTLVGASDLKDILTTASTLTQSTTVSMQKNYFQKQTEYAILAEMDADRLKQWSTITQLLTKNDEGQYPLSAALNDLQQYRRAGTGTAALTALTQQAGAKSNDAATQIKKTQKVE